MLNRKINSYTILIKGILSVTLGIIFFFTKQDLLKLIISVFGYGIIAFDLLGLILYFITKDKKNSLSEILSKTLLDIAFASLLILGANLLFTSITLIFGIYLFAHSVLHLINYFLYQSHHIPGGLKILIQFIVTFLFSLLLTLHPSKSIVYMEIVMGIYLILYGINKIVDFISEIIPAKIRHKYKSRIKITLPIFMNFFIPAKLIDLVNENLKVNKIDLLDVQKGNSGNPDIEVLVHLSPKGTAKMGHVEIAFEGTTYSFGNYNIHSRVLFDTIGDGILLIADRDKYIKYAVTKRDRYIVSFGISLTEEQIKKVRQQINNLIYNNTVDFYSDLELAEKGLLPKQKYTDMTSEIHKFANGHYKKIIKGRNKKFFVLKTNCVMVAESILESTGAKILGINGLITPGTYYEYLNDEFLKKNSNVITRKVYTKYDFTKKSKS